MHLPHIASRIRPYHFTPNITTNGGIGNPSERPFYQIPSACSNHAPINIPHNPPPHR